MPFIAEESERGYGAGETLFTRRAALRLAQYDMKYGSVREGMLGDNYIKN
ncbi:hypothetical protein [Bacteroides hominis]|nr:hypothetical protein [Bacteroides fragilis]MCE8655306.1 hypothetical protein [Bacteroides fragilis]MCY1134074.1 hypothetical protein [Bacteroides fragilis]